MNLAGGETPIWRGGVNYGTKKGRLKNQPPIAGEDTATVVAGETVSIPVLANDTDPEGGPLTVTAAKAASGSVAIGADGTLSYTAPAGFSGTDTITYTVADAEGATAEGRVTVTVEAAAPANQPPIAGDDTATAVSGETVSIPVLANDTDPEGGPLTVTSAEAMSGSVAVGAAGTVSYTAPAGFYGTDTITYTVADAEGATAEGRVTVTVEPPAPENQPPLARDDAVTVVSGGTISIPVLANDIDPEGGPLTVTAAKAASGSVTVGADGTVSYTAPEGFSGTDTVTYTVADAEGATAEGRVTVTVVTLEISTSDTSGDFTVEAADGDLTLTVIEPAEYAGEFLVKTADLLQGPVNLLPPIISGGTAPGDVLTASPGLWAYDEAFGTLTFSQQWYRGDAPIEGSTTKTYVVDSADGTSGLRYVCHATNGAGTRSAEVEAIAPGAVEVPDTSFSETGVVFPGNANLVRNADLAPDSSTSLWFVSLVPDHTGRQGILRQTGTGNGIEIWDDAVRLSLTVTGKTQQLKSRIMTEDQRVHVLASMEDGGTGTSRLRMVSRFAGEDSWTDEGSVEIPAGSADFTFGSFAVGARNAPTNSQNLDAIVYRIAMWAGGAVPDVLDPAVQQAFVTPDGTLADPAAAHALGGQPRVDLFGPAADYTAGVNHGTAGNFDIINGSFTDA